MMSFAHVATPCSVTGFTQTAKTPKTYILGIHWNDEFYDSTVHIVKGRMK